MSPQLGPQKGREVAICAHLERLRAGDMSPACHQGLVSLGLAASKQASRHCIQQENGEPWCQKAPPNHGDQKKRGSAQESSGSQPRDRQRRWGPNAHCHLSSSLPGLASGVQLSRIISGALGQCSEINRHERGLRRVPRAEENLITDKTWALELPGPISEEEQCKGAKLWWKSHTTR